MESSDLLRYLVSALGNLGTRYFITGSTASIFASSAESVGGFPDGLG